VVSTEVLPYFMFTIVARGNIILSKYVQVATGVKSQRISFTPNFDMVPQATLFVSYVVNGEMRSDEETIVFQKDFANSVCANSIKNNSNLIYSFLLNFRLKSRHLKVQNLGMRLAYQL